MTNAQIAEYENKLGMHDTEESRGMKLSKDTLEIASMALNAKVASMEKYPEGSSGHAMKKRYLSALNEVNSKLGL